MNDTPQTRPSLLLRLRDAGNDGAWAEFAQIYSPLVARYCRQQGLQEADAADVAQEVLRAVAGKMPEFEYDPRRGKFHGWLLQVTRNKVQKFWVRHYRNPQPAGETTMDRFTEQPGADEQARWEEDFRQRLFEWAVEQARPEFQPATWDAFRLTALESLSVKETAARVGISVGAVYIARSRVLARLRELVAAASDDALTALEE